MESGAASAGPRRQGAGGLTLWRVSDGKAGHDNQSLGLAEALGRLVKTDIRSLASQPLATALQRWCVGRFPEADGLPDPDLIIGAGHGTHLTMLAARRCRGGRAIVLMSPSLPSRWFDLCIAPAHDDIAGSRVIRSRGAINRVRPGPTRVDGHGLILLGGPARHFVWQDATVLAGVKAILDGDPASGWTLATSPRTPASLTVPLEALVRPGVDLAPYAQTGPDWLSTQLARAARVWVSEDSVSMIFEALTCGAAVGLIGLARRHQNRVVSEIDTLIEQAWLVRFAPGDPLPVLNPPASALDEASRCAELVLARWPALGRR